MKKVKIQISAWNFVYVKDSIRIGYGGNFRTLGCTLTKMRLLESLDGLYILPYKILKNNCFPFITDMFKWAESLDLEVFQHGLSFQSLKSNIAK
jgi:hypothetical protein